MEVPNQGVSWVGSLQKLWGRICSVLFSQPLGTAGNPWHFLAGRCIAQLSASVFAWPPPLWVSSPFLQGRQWLDLGPTLIQCELTLPKYIGRDYFQSKVTLWDSRRTCILGGHCSTQDRHMEGIFWIFCNITVETWHLSHFTRVTYSCYRTNNLTWGWIQSYVYWWGGAMANSSM